MTPQQKALHFHKIITGINTFIDQGIIKIDGDTVYVYEEVIGDTDQKKQAFLKNLYSYFRLKLKKPECFSFYLMNIESDQFIGKFIEMKPLVF